MWLYPDEDIGLFASTNGPPTIDNTWGLILILQMVSDILLEETPWINASSACVFPSPWKPKSAPSTHAPADDPLPAELAADYAGTFSHEGFGDVIVSYNYSARHLEMRMGRFLRALLLYDKTHDAFLAKLVDKYSYESYTIPVRFKKTTVSGVIGVLAMPLSTPLATSEPVEFIKVVACLEPSDLERIYSNTNDCISKANVQSVSSPIIVYLFVICYLAVHNIYLV